MKLRLCHLLLSLGSFTTAWGQAAAPNVGDPVKELRAALAPLDPARIPTGVLLDRMMFLTNPRRYAGQGDTVADYRTFEQQYWGFYRAALDTTQLPSPATVRARLSQRAQQGVVPLLMLNYRYNATSCCRPPRATALSPSTR